MELWLHQFLLRKTNDGKNATHKFPKETENMKWNRVLDKKKNEKKKSQATNEQRNRKKKNTAAVETVCSYGICIADKRPHYE